MKKIKYYRKSNYGQTMEYVLDQGDAKIISRLTGQKTINSIIRELIHDLTGGLVAFEETFAP